MRNKLKFSFFGIDFQLQSPLVITFPERYRVSVCPLNTEFCWSEEWVLDRYTCSFRLAKHLGEQLAKDYADKEDRSYKFAVYRVRHGAADDVMIQYFVHPERVYKRKFTVVEVPLKYFD